MSNETVKSILGTGLGLQAVAILGQNYKVANRSLKTKPKTLKMAPKKIIKLGVGNIVGIGLIKAQSEMIGDL